MEIKNKMVGNKNIVVGNDKILQSQNPTNPNADNVPALRFPEFKGEWEKKKLGEVTNWSSGGTPPKDNPLFWDGDIPWISASSMRGLVYHDSGLKITEAGLKKGSKLATKGSLLILVRGSMLFNKIPIGIVSRDVAFNQDVKSIVVDKCSSSSEYILNWFIANELKIFNMVTATGIGAGKLDLHDLKNLEIILPTLPEQKRIASFFTVLDQKITKLKQKKSLLEQYKKGVMQKLFSQELRFKDENGKEFPKWEKKKLGEIGTFFSGGTPLTTKRQYFNGNIPFIRSGEINSNSTEQFISEEGLKNSSSKMVEVGDLLYALYGATSGEVGISKIKGAINQAILCIRTNMDNRFLHNYLLMEKENIIKTYLQGGQGNLSAEIIKSIQIPVPSIEEQTKIANFLSAIDKKINRTENQIQQTQEWKKGLLQRMFV